MPAAHQLIPFSESRELTVLRGNYIRDILDTASRTGA